MQGIIANIEIVVALSGFVLAVLVPRALNFTGTDLWIATAATAVAVGLLHSGVLWVVRRRQRRLRRELLLEAMGNLASIRDQMLSEIMIRCEMVETTAPEVRAHLACIRQRAEQLWEDVHNVSTSLNIVYNEPQSREEQVQYEPNWRPSPEV